MGPVTGSPHWFEPIARHLGPAYLRYSFTRGTEQEVAFLTEAMSLEPGMRVLDVGCGPGRHAHALAAAGLHVLGVDISTDFVELARQGAPPGAEFTVADARRLPALGRFDAAISLCQGAFGLTAGPGAQAPGDREFDGPVLESIHRQLVPGGILALTAFSAYFAVRWQEEHDTFDAALGVNHETTSVRDEDGTEAPVELWTTCYTPRELRLLLRASGFEPTAVWSAAPGAYARAEPTIESPEFLALARRQG